MQVEVIRSARRRRTVSARVIDGVLRLAIPSWMSADDEAHWIATMTEKFARQVRCDDIDLAGRAAALARRYQLPAPASIRWVTNQRDRWGSCTPADGAIRISDRVAAFPKWVLDYVVLHELAHLVEPGHGPAFKRLERRFPRAERAMGYLEAKGVDTDVPPARSGPRARGAEPWNQLPLFSSG